MNEHDGLAVPRPVLDTNADVRRIIQSGTGTDFSDEVASNRRLAVIERDAAALRAIRDDSGVYVREIGESSDHRD